MTSKYELIPERIAEARARGEKVWWYVAFTPFPPYATFLLENPWLCQRLLMGAMAWKYQPDGFLYYSSALWLDPAFKNLTDRAPISGAPRTDWPGRSIGEYNGDGVLVYPAADYPIPSARMKQIRDGLDDYHYLALLRSALDDAEAMPEAWRNEARRELAIEPELVASLAEYARDPALMADKRERVAALLEAYHAARRR